MKEHLVCGLGEVGSAIQKIFNADGIDPNYIGPRLKKRYKYIHICFGWCDTFIADVGWFQKKYEPEYTIIHSTVPVGTSRQLGAIHSPIRGIHPHLYEGIMTFVKFLGGPKAGFVADVFRKAGIKICLVDKQETTELLKILDTEYFRACIDFTHRAGDLCKQYQVPFHEVYTLPNMTYNEGYRELGHPEYQRPVLQDIPGPIGGHCLIPNSKLL